MVNEEGLKKLYEGLTGKYDGYIQMSNREIETVLREEKLPDWEDIHKNGGFIFEIALFEIATNKSIKSILIRQINDKWSFYEEDISALIKAKEKDKDFKDIQLYHSKFGGVKMAQIWKETKDDKAEGFIELRLEKVVFAGFETTKEDSHDKSTI